MKSINGRTFFNSFEKVEFKQASIFITKQLEIMKNKRVNWDLKYEKDIVAIDTESTKEKPLYDLFLN